MKLRRECRVDVCELLLLDGLVVVEGELNADVADVGVDHDEFAVLARREDRLEHVADDNRHDRFDELDGALLLGLEGGLLLGVGADHRRPHVEAAQPRRELLVLELRPLEGHAAQAGALLGRQPAEHQLGDGLLAAHAGRDAGDARELRLVAWHRAWEVAPRGDLLRRRLCLGCRDADSRNRRLEGLAQLALEVGEELDDDGSADRRGRLAGCTLYGRHADHPGAATGRSL
mmetsp:Transcript_25724/g.68758  ORF Transcript_25724/g.68758 Transcript_25724/m.68758 type:complete len:231 (-) Transcript_25724:22-714(-)